jgi:uncharacterized protein YegP (UPF0339 family)
VTTTFGIDQDSTDQYRRRLTSGSGQIIATGGAAYTNRVGVRNGVDVLRLDISGAAIDEVLT